MGYYVNEDSKGNILPNRGKAKVLIADGAKSLSSFGLEYQNNLVCVVDNGPFEAAAYMFSKGEFARFAEPDGRPKQWLSYDYASQLAKQFTHFV